MIYTVPFELSNIKLQSSCGDNPSLNFFCEGQNSCNFGILVFFPNAGKYRAFVRTRSSDIDIYIFPVDKAFTRPPGKGWCCSAYNGGNTDFVVFNINSPCFLWIVWNAYDYQNGDTLTIGVVNA